MPAPSASGFDLLCRNTTIATADRQQTNATTITALVVARMPKFIVGPQPVGTSRVFPQPVRESECAAKIDPPNLPVLPNYHVSEVGIVVVHQLVYDTNLVHLLVPSVRIWRR